MEFGFDVVHRAEVKHLAVDALSRMRTDVEDKEPLEAEVPFLLMNSEPKSDDAITVATVR